MAMAEIVLNVDVRGRTGTGGARESRRAGEVPGILYGGSLPPVAISVKSNEFRKALLSGKLMGHRVTLSHEGKTQMVIAKDIQFHPVTDQPVHFDLYRVDAHQLIKINVPVHFAHQDASPGMKRGGALNIAYHEIELLVPADEIPEEVVVDLSGLEVGGQVHINDVTLPKGSKPALRGNFVIASITATGATKDADAAEA
jgi:large subunit ribosomal protein L25